MKDNKRKNHKHSHSPVLDEDTQTSNIFYSLFPDRLVSPALCVQTLLLTNNELPQL